MSTVTEVITEEARMAIARPQLQGAGGISQIDIRNIERAISPSCPTSPALRHSFGKTLATARSVSAPGKSRRLIYEKPPPPLLPEDIHNRPILDVMAAKLASIDIDDCEVDGENAFFVCDLAEVWRANCRWSAAFAPVDAESSIVEAFYAVKCNPDPTVVTLLANLGIGFDCASQAEIELVLSTGVAASRIIYANPCKAASFIRHAAASGVEMMTFDNIDELNKIAKYYPSAKLVLRILTDDEGSLCRLGLKFGASMKAVRPLLMHARAVGLDVIGVSFHVGSGCTNADLYDRAIQSADWVFGVAEEIGYKMDFLDIGGGFGGETFEDTAAVIRLSLDRLFPKSRGVRVIAEPGRFYVAQAYELATHIIAMRSVGEEDVSNVKDEEAASVMYYINDGVYGAFNCVMFDHQIVHPQILTLDGEVAPSDVEDYKHELSVCSIWGPTCDSIDVVQAEAHLPVGRIGIGDWLRWPDMGAYTVCAASQFNGFRKSLVEYTINDNGVAGVYQKVASLVGQ